MSVYPTASGCPQKDGGLARGSTNEALVVAYWHVPGLTVPQREGNKYIRLVQDQARTLVACG